MMTLAQLMDNLNMSPMLKSLVKGYAVARYPNLLGKMVSLTMDGETGIVTVCLDHKPFFSKTFEEIEAFVNGSKKEQPVSGSTPEQPANENFAMDAGSAADSIGVPG